MGIDQSASEKAASEADLCILGMEIQGGTASQMRKKQLKKVNRLVWLRLMFLFDWPPSKDEKMLSPPLLISKKYGCHSPVDAGLFLER
jgi:hypothetical protein